MFKKLDLFETVTPIVLMVFLLGIRLGEGYLLFHVLVELFAVIIGVLIAIIAYYMYKFTRNNFLLFLGIGFFWTAILDLFHMLSYYGMNIYSDVSTQNPSTTLWIAARIFQITTLLIAPFIRFDTISPRRVFGWFAVAAGGAYIGTFMGIFPTMYVANEGLTATKIASEYAIMFASMIALVIYRSKRENYHPLMYRSICWSLLLGIAAEGCFTLYIDVYGFMNLVGHILKFFAYWMIFRGIVVTALKEPFSVMAKASSAYDAIPVPVVVVDTEGIIRQINRATAQCATPVFDEFVGQNNHDLLHPPGISQSECEVCQAIEKGEYRTFEVAFADKYKQYTISPIKTKDTISGTLQICIDMTAQRQAERRLIQEGTLLKTIINTAPVRLFWKDKESVYLGCNNLFAQDAGLDDSESIVGKRDDELIWHDQAELYRLDDHQVIESGISRINYEEPQERGVEDTSWLRTSKVPLREDVDGPISGVVGAYTDITEIRRTQLQIKESEKFYRTIFASVHEAIIVLEQYTIVDCNGLALSLFGTDKETLIGKDIFDLAYDIECRKESFHYYLDLAYQGQYVTDECSLRLYNAPDEIKIIEFTLSGFSDNDENKLIMIARDLTEHIEEERIFRMNTRQAQMGEMISMIAHQWRQPLAIINAITSQMRLQELMKDENNIHLIDNLKKIEEQSTHLSQTISAYRDFFRPDKPKEHFNISILIHNALSLVDHTLKNHGILVETISLHDPKLFTYRNEVLQVLIALLKNSLDAFVEKRILDGHIRITLDGDDEYGIISIRDNAGGIAPEIINKLFIPYFTTKTKNNGTGLGLYMSRMIIQDHCHGMISVNSQGNETIFTIKLPYEKETK
ncbi:MAG: MASE3 domain-containing protein [Sulfuricurvum sp.]|uniref:MASE3 domain-containing protein n=1 Tax=Sulfuricurvum sp. TaxID=2025608 RepID=UPI002629E942|nr:MASE3 domain-containing protein [Sulfuricurvum sp.]MDD5160087.1 MASE3 domain-containing protein [Sulfuricurvum sp.]